MSLESPNDLVQQLINDKAFRDAFVYEHVKRVIPYQLRAMRKERKWTQGDLGKAVGKPRNVVNRLENPNYGKLTLKTLFEIASGCDVALLVRFVPFSRLLKESEDLSLEALSAASVTGDDEASKLERQKLEEWAAEDELDTELAAAAASKVVLETGDLFPGLPDKSTTATMEYSPVLPGMYPVAVSNPDRPVTGKKQTQSPAISTTETVSPVHPTTLRKAAGVK